MRLAHHVLIDGFAVFVVPVVLALLALRWAERRARARAEERQASEGGRHRGEESG